MVLLCVDKVLIGVTENFVYSYLFLGGINQSESGDIGSSVFEVLQFYHMQVLGKANFQQILINDLSLLLRQTFQWLWVKYVHPF